MESMKITEGYLCFNAILSGPVRTALTSLGFYRSQVDHSVFFKHSDRGMIALLVYVDDIFALLEMMDLVFLP